MIADGVAPMAGVELGVRLHPSFELELDYQHLAKGPDSVGLLGAGLRWLAVNGDFATFLYAGASVPLAGLEPIADPVGRGRTLLALLKKTDDHFK